MRRKLSWFGGQSCSLARLRVSIVGVLAFAVPLALEALAGGQPKALNTVPVPMPSNLGDFIADMGAARVLGKALFWDMQTGGDGRTACATCHFHAGTDARTKNTIGVRGTAFNHFAANQTVAPGDYPFHRLADPANRNSAVLFDTSDVTGAQGVIKKNFVALSGGPVDIGTTVPDPIFNVGGINTRQVTGRNTPTMINAVFNDRQFWDGRANRFFNGVNPFGDQDPNARVWRGSTPDPVAILLANASLASQAVGPPNNNVEMSWNGRTFPQLGRKMLALKPLALQHVDAGDSVLGPFAETTTGLTFADYAALVRLAFRSEWWGSANPVNGTDTQMEANFSLFWGLSVNLYETLLVSDDSPFDRFARGNSNALTSQQKAGMSTFFGAGNCGQCHVGPEFTLASSNNIRGQLVKFVNVAQGSAFVDNGFFNIGVRPTANDLGVGNPNGGAFGTVSIAQRIQNGENLQPGLTIPAGARLAIFGAVKIPTLRNIELTGPYMHNGGMSTLTQVVEFYARGTDFHDANIDNLAKNVDGVGKVRGDAAKNAEVVAFLKSLTDDRVRFQKAPFDHPAIVVPNGHSGFSMGVALDNNVTIPAVGAAGGPAINSFEAILNGAPL